MHDLYSAISVTVTLGDHVKGLATADTMYDFPGQKASKPVTQLMACPCLISFTTHLKVQKHASHHSSILWNDLNILVSTAELPAYQGRDTVLQMDKSGNGPNH